MVLNHLVYLLVHHFYRLQQVLVDLVSLSQRSLFGRRALLLGNRVHLLLCSLIYYNKEMGSMDQGSLVVAMRGLVAVLFLDLGVTLRIILTFYLSFRILSLGIRG